MITENYQIELRHFTYFLMVAQELHFRKAAERLFISQPGLSSQIKQMEELLEVKLFLRDKKSVTLTPAGHFLKQEVEYLFGQLKNIKKQVKLIGEGSLGELRIGFLGSAMQNVIPELLVNLRDKHPTIKTSLEELSNKAQIHALEKGALDLGFVRLGHLPPSLESRPVFEDTFSLVLPTKAKIDAKNFKGMKQVADESFILFSREYSPLYYDTVMSICKASGFQPFVSHKSVHAQTIFKLVENGLGIAIVPTSLKHGFKMGVKFIELKNVPQRAILSVVWNKENRNPVLSHCLNSLLSGIKL